jgi:outer membrane protein TolC
MIRPLALLAVLAVPAVLPPARVHAQDVPSASPVQFWAAVGDSTLHRLVAEAVAGSPDVQVAVARVRGARANRLGSALDFAPTVTAVGG